MMDGEHKSFEFNGKTMIPGTEFAVKGERGGRFHFVSHVILGENQWINCVGGKQGHHMFRAFRPERIARITKLVPLPARP